MSKTNWQDPKSTEIRSTHISGLQEAVGKLEESIGIDTIAESNIPLTEVFISNDDRCRIYQAPEGKRNWLSSPTPVIYKNGTIITTDFEIDYGGGAIIFTTPILETDILTADATYTINSSPINEAIKDLNTIISSGSIQSPPISLGCSKITIPEMPATPKIEFEGFSYVNLMGKDGNCEDLSKWSSYASTLSLDTSNNVFGANCIKSVANPNYITLINKTSLKRHIGGKKVFVSFYIKTNTGEQSVLVRMSSLYGGGTAEYTRTVAFNTTTTMQRVGAKLDLSDSGDYELYLWISKAYIAEGTEMYVDGIMVNVIGDDEFNDLSVDQLLEKYPYVDSYGCLINPYFENRRYNLVRNGNCEEGIAYWYNNNPSTQTFSTENGKFKSVTTSPGKYVYQIVKVKKNTNYYIQANVSSEGTPRLRVFTSDISKEILAGGGVFNTAENTEIAILLHTGTTTGTFYFDSIILVEGTEPPTEYESCDLQRFVVEGQFASGDKVKIENGKVSGLLNWKHRTLFGKDYGWNLSEGTYVGFKKINAYIPHLFDNFLVTKYDGQILPFYNDSTQSGDQVYNTPSLIEIWINNTDSGWNDSINPNSDERKAYMNGWKAVANNGTRYTLWVSKVDNNPPEKFSTTLASDTIVGQYTISVTDATKLKVGRKIVISGASLFVSTISSIDGNIVTLGNAMTMQIPSGTGVASSDDGTTDLSMLNFCKNNVAPGYEGYKLHYKLANPEPITDANVHIKGEIWDLVKGDNYVTVDSGIVLGEVANPLVANDNKCYINTHNIYNQPDSNFKYLTEKILGIYKNNIFDNLWATSTFAAYGKMSAQISSDYYNSNAIYTADYQILKTLHTQTFGSLSLSYPQSILATLDGHSKALEQKQSKNSTLDTLIDLSIFEKINLTNVIANWVCVWGGIYLDLKIPMAEKKVIPLITISDLVIKKGTASSDYVDITNLCKNATIVVTTNMIIFRKVITDAATIADIKSYGAVISCNITADCRRRV